jgi:hypothetical protein
MEALQVVQGKPAIRSVNMATSATKSISKASSTARKQLEVLEDDVHEGLDLQLAHLNREIAKISQAVADFSLDAYDTTLDAVDDLRHQAARAGRQIGKQANAAGHTIRDNPVPTIAVLGVIALLSAMVWQSHEHR